MASSQWLVGTREPKVVVVAEGVELPLSGGAGVRMVDNEPSGVACDVDDEAVDCSRFDACKTSLASCRRVLPIMAVASGSPSAGARDIPGVDPERSMNFNISSGRESLERISAKDFRFEVIYLSINTQCVCVALLRSTVGALFFFLLEGGTSILSLLFFLCIFLVFLIIFGCKCENSFLPFAKHENDTVRIQVGNCRKFRVCKHWDRENRV